MGTIDLDAARAARAELDEQGPEIVFKGQRFPLPAEMPFSVAELWYKGDTKAGLNLLLAERAEAFWELEPTVQDAQALIRGVSQEYGFGGGSPESSASNGSSPSTSSRSRPTSRASTG